MEVLGYDERKRISGGKRLLKPALENARREEIYVNWEDTFMFMAK
ncbi:MAG: hypothetical protein QW424_03410 [Candidatus Bathyarchaeia archaeon]